jgi:hypothetical protein
LAESLEKSGVAPGSREVDQLKIVKNLRFNINKSFMQDGFGLTALTPKPWEDYILPETSHFTYDVGKILRDFDEIAGLKLQQNTYSRTGKNDGNIARNIEAIQTRMPHVIVLFGRGGVGKCLGRGTKVIMWNGEKRNVEDVKLGDLLMGPDSKPRKVLNATHGKGGALYRVKQNNGKNYICNDKHILSLKKEGRHNDQPVFVSVKDYYTKSKSWKKKHYGWKTGVEFEEQNVPIDPYWLGLWLGDGTSLKPSITVADKKIKNWLEKWAKRENLFVRCETKKKTQAVAMNFSPRQGSGFANNKTKSSLKELGIFGNKHIPTIYQLNSRDNRLRLLAGLIDSDGYRCDSGSLQFFNTNEKLASDVAELGRSLGFKVFERSSIKKLKSYNYEVRCYTVTFGGNLSEIPTKLLRKKGHDNPQKIGVKCGIKVEPIGDGEYFGFELDGDHQFLLEDFTVTHNSAFPVHFASLLEFDVWDLNIMASHSKWIGEGPERMRESLDKILKSSHVVLRVDEYDRAMGSSQASGHGMHEAHKQVEAEFMNWLQNTQEENLLVQKNIFLVLTTNHKENITGPLLRSGRADLVIEIDNFDIKSMRETFLSAPRRMANRGIHVVGFDNQDDLLKEIEKLDIDRLAEIATTKGFTVRDVDVVLIEMASHNYYYKKDKSKGIPWNTEAFVKVLERSEGSAKDEETNELVLGDRFYNDKEEEKPQYDVVETVVVDQETNEKKRKLDLEKIEEHEKELVKDQFK